MRCPVCDHAFVASGRRRFCGDRCRRTAWTRRHTPPPATVVVPAAGVPRRGVTVYECGSCGARTVGEQYCGDCATFMSRVGWGGQCRRCDGAVAVADLIPAQ